MKRILLFAACAAISLSAYCDKAGIDELLRDDEAKYSTTKVKIGDLYYNLSSKNKTARVVAVKTGVNKYAGEVRVPGSVEYQGESYGVIKIDKAAFSGCKDLTDVYIEDDVLGISTSAFSGCSGLVSIRLPKRLSLIDMQAFDGCTNLNRVIVPDLAMWCTVCIGATSMTYGGGGFTGSPLYYGGLYGEDGNEITELVIPEGVTEISDYAFLGCHSISSVKLSGSVQSIGYKAFSDCKNLVTADLSGSLKEAGKQAFFGCTALSTLILPGTLKTISENMCNSCSSLEEVSIPEGVENIESGAFLYCTSLTTVYIPSTMKTIKGGLGNGNVEKKIIIPDLKTWCDITFDSPAAYGATLCLEDGTELNELIFPDDVTTIPQNAFGGYRGLNYIDFNKVETIGALAFQECDIESVTFSESVREIGMGAFQSCQSLSSIYLPSSIELLSEDAFAFCPALMSVSYDVVKFPEYGGFANSIFTRSPIDKATLYVPTNMIEACKTEEPWSGFGQIVALPTGTNPNAIQNTLAASPRGVVYNLQGRRLSAESLPKGIYIVNGKKVLIK